jgi:hypothetical protein
MEALRFNLLVSQPHGRSWPPPKQAAGEQQRHSHHDECGNQRHTGSCDRAFSEPARAGRRLALRELDGAEPSRTVVRVTATGGGAQHGITFEKSEPVSASYPWTLEGLLEGNVRSDRSWGEAGQAQRLARSRVRRVERWPLKTIEPDRGRRSDTPRVRAQPLAPPSSSRQQPCPGDRRCIDADRRHRRAVRGRGYGPHDRNYNASMAWIAVLMSSRSPVSASRMRRLSRTIGSFSSIGSRPSVRSFRLAPAMV